MASKRHRKELRAASQELAVAAPELRALETALVERFMLSRMLGMTHAGRRDVYGVLGYDEKITAMQYRDRYSRGGIIARVVDSLANAVWCGEGKVYEDEDPDTVTQFEAEWESLNEQHDVWSTLRRTHIMASLTSFSGLLIGGLGELDTPLAKGRPGGVLYLRPYGGGVIDVNAQRGTGQGLGSDLTVLEWDEDSKSPRYGLPLLYQLKQLSTASPSQYRPVHYTRIHHVPAYGFLEDAVFGPPALEDVWNYAIDLDKVAGGGSEAYWLRANAGTHLNVDKKMTFANSTDRDAEIAHLQEQAEKYAHQMTRMIRTTGVDIKQLGSDVADFSGPVETLVTLIAGTKRIPKRILLGTERGELSSGQDEDNWADQVTQCRKGYAHPIVLRPFIKRLIDFGYLSKPAQWYPGWAEEESMNEAEKITAAKTMAETNDHGAIIVRGSEIREFLGYEPLTEAEIADEMKERKMLAEIAATKEPEDELDEDVDPEEEQIDKIERALRTAGGTLTIAVKG